MSNNIVNISDMWEIVQLQENEDRWNSEPESKYVLIPHAMRKIRIHSSENRHIYFENFMQMDRGGGDDGKESGSGGNSGESNNRKRFTYVLYMTGKQNMKLLHEFVDRCVATYRKTKETNQQMIYEYLASETDEDGNSEMQFSSFLFKSNKWLDRNIFFENRQKFCESVRNFPCMSFEESATRPKTAAELEYEYRGRTFKNAILLHGPPGCGKTSVIKGILNETKRHGVVVQWSRITTCKEFSQLFRSLTINGTKRSLGELCYIFEDFDANRLEILKRRNGISTPPIDACMMDIDVDLLEMQTEDPKSAASEKKKKLALPRKDDELTLDYVLNVFDGVIELYGALIIFTTNAKLETFDPALIRPGRIDTIIEMKPCNHAIIHEIIAHHFRLETTCGLDIETIPEYVLTPSDVETACMNCATANAAVLQLQSKQNI
jgi:hypothetical protein